MNLSFLPFSLGGHINCLQLYLTYKETDNEVNIYELNKTKCPSILGVDVERTTLYYFEQRLISTYLLVSKRNTIPVLLKQMQQIEQAIGFPAKETEEGNVLTFSWADEEVSCSINLDGESGNLYVYLTLKEYLI